MTPGDKVRVNYGLFNPRLVEAYPSMSGEVVRTEGENFVVLAKGYEYFIEPERNKRLALVVPAGGNG